MRHHARRLLTALAAAACLGALAAPATAVDVRIDVTNAAAPTVRIVTPADGARIPAGTAVPVRVEGAGADTLSMAVDATPTWSGPGNLLAGQWSPEVGTYRLVAVAERAGAPDALAVSEVRVIAPDDDDDAGAAPPASPPPADPSPPARSAPGGGAPSVPGPGGSSPAPGGPVVPAVAVPALAGPRPARAPALPPTSREEPAARAAAAADEAGDESPLMALVGAIGRILSSPERVAWVVAFPLLLVIAALAYALLQRFIDGGPKLAWRGRGRSEDQVIEF